MPEEATQEAVADEAKGRLRVFLAGATGVIGVRLVPLLIASGHTVAGLTRSPGKAGRAQGVEEHESRVLGAGGVVVRYGQLYGPGTYYEKELPSQPRIHVDAAARATPPLMLAPSGVVTVAEDAPGA